MRLRTESILFNIDPEFNPDLAKNLEQTFTDATGEPQIPLYNSLSRSYALLSLSTFMSAQNDFSVALTQVKTPQGLMEESSMKESVKETVEVALLRDAERIERKREEEKQIQNQPNENDLLAQSLSRSNNQESLRMFQLLEELHRKEKEQRYNRESLDTDRDGIPDYRDLQPTKYNRHALDL